MFDKIYLINYTYQNISFFIREIMKYRVIKKQENSKNCLVCGLKNPFGLKTNFYELENGELLAIFKCINEHQSYPNRAHGGIISSILDEAIGRAIMIKYGTIWGVTIELNVQFKKPVPIGEDLKVVSRIIKDSSRIFEGTGELILNNGEIAATGYGRYLKVPLDKIGDFDHEEQEWRVIENENDPKEIELPDKN